MWYEDEANFMKQMVRYTVPDAHIKAKRDAVKHLYSFQPAPQIISGLVLYYPGYKNAVGDYKLTFLGKELKHSHICNDIFNYCSFQTNFPRYMALILKAIYENGISAMSPVPGFNIILQNKSYDFEEFKTLIYWITLQEEINYPIKNNAMSVKLPFSRYYESIYVAYTNQNNININTIMQRADGTIPYNILEGLNVPENLILPTELTDLHTSINS
ncbi:hypothetical protein CN300_00430 [Bacillus thuringiensis]|uniref:Uncharacterized protein n=1 Tax=Bacillus thuringiensis serovar kumamotoensis TaxID=132267 RepID=A0A9X6JU29_BACUK|nr:MULTISPECIES: hypothetical protein [Bacillus cereus group]ASI81959.1 hypothetical protein FORC48_0864 [Bacillus cereus]MCU5667836.1 hypothetical protein [Bacillus cereus]MEC2870785.1 hypothetical protein [Bacillus cereus]MEE3956990.1 hypothetical protein [Bacillus thuringiensis]OTZ77965.1 hypothetical protein BK769_04195 [Bacillus thuringiensis serovar kumamtoensis]